MADAWELDGEAVWVFPGESGWKRPIGALATDPEYLAPVQRQQVTPLPVTGHPRAGRGEPNRLEG